MSSATLLSVQAGAAQPVRLISRGTQLRRARTSSPRVMAISKGQELVQTTAKQSLALLAATQLLAAPIAGPAFAVDVSDAKGAVDSVLDKLPNQFPGRSEKVNQGPQEKSSAVAESIKISSSDKTNEADSAFNALTNPKPTSGAPDTSGVGKSLGTTDGNL